MGLSTSGGLGEEGSGRTTVNLSLSLSLLLPPSFPLLLISKDNSRITGYFKHDYTHASFIDGETEAQTEAMPPRAPSWGVRNQDYHWAAALSTSPGLGLFLLLSS